MSTTDMGSGTSASSDPGRSDSVRSETDSTDGLNSIYRRIAWRLMPLLLVAQVMAYLDRVNVGSAKLQMAGELGLSDAVYGLGAGIFFLGYFLFEVPSNLLLHRIGARIWIARIIVTWGIVSALAAFVHSPETFYLQRFLLGMAEAGFFPGVVLYLTYWFPANRRGKMTTLFMSATALAGIFGNVVSGWIMVHLNGISGISGWRWTFIIEGLPTIAVGLTVRYFLPNGPSDASWLMADDVEKVRAALSDDQKSKVQTGRRSSPIMLEIAMLTAIYFLLLTGLYGIGFWLPTLVKGAGLSDLSEVGLYSAIPYGIAVVVMNLCALRADREGKWPAYVRGGALASAVGFAIGAVYSRDLWLVMFGMSLASAGVLTALPLFWNLPTARLAGGAAAAGIAVINSIGNLSGFVGPIAFGWLNDRLHEVTTATLVLAASAGIAAILTWMYQRHVAKLTS